MERNTIEITKFKAIDRADGNLTDCFDILIRGTRKITTTAPLKVLSEEVERDPTVQDLPVYLYPQRDRIERVTVPQYLLRPASR